MIRRTASLALALTALCLGASGAGAQLNPGIHVARATDSFGGANGVGASVELSFPLFPIDLFVAAEYFFPDCGSVDDCSLSGGSADVHLGLPIPVLSPYAAGGLVYRRTDAGGGAGAVSNTGFGGGVGVNLSALVLGAYAEVRYEVVDPDDQLVLRLGLRF
ncbi:MAG: hypothetical protein FIA95_11910 [Gemmatimonadetes bacterium]|nr:hypothetical protein [Gemmatimonadota bacterium]